MKHIMLDLETLSTQPNAAILTIGACVFDPHSKAPITEVFERGILPSDAGKFGHVDSDTVAWWGRQTPVARARALGGTDLLVDALSEFKQWATGPTIFYGDNICVWGNGANFDQVIIRSAYRAVGLLPFWPFYNDRCHRTVVNLIPKPLRPQTIRKGTAHSALDDAVFQAEHLQDCMIQLGVKE